MIRSDGCITVKQLKAFLAGLPDVDEVTGDDAEVWIGNGEGTSNPCREACRLNRSDVILQPGDAEDWIRPMVESRCSEQVASNDTDAPAAHIPEAAKRLNSARQKCNDYCRGLQEIESAGPLLKAADMAVRDSDSPLQRRELIDGLSMALLANRRAIEELQSDRERMARAYLDCRLTLRELECKRVEDMSLQEHLKENEGD